MIFNLELETLQLAWFVLLGVLLAGYAVLDGFDLGVGILHLFVPKSNAERRVFVNAIGPMWDGNEVWLVTFGGAMFAAFPEAYATTFSAFYEALMLVLLGLILRATALEFRSKVEDDGWRRFWDIGFGVGSLLATLVFGVAVGNAMLGIALDERHEFTGTLLDHFSLFAVVVGLLAIAVFLMHGAIYLYLKTEGELQERLVPVMWRTYFIFLILFGITTAMTLRSLPHAVGNFEDAPLLWFLPLILFTAVANIPRGIKKGRPGQAFISSCVVIISLCSLLGAAVFPDLVASSVDPETNSLTIHNASSSAKTLDIMLLIAAIGMPFVIGYTTWVYWTFRGRVVLDDHSY